MFNTTSVAADAGTNKDTDPAGLNLVKTTAYDAQGRVIKATLPKSAGTDAGPPSRPTVPLWRGGFGMIESTIPWPAVKAIAYALRWGLWAVTAKASHAAVRARCVTFVTDLPTGFWRINERKC
ncbi:hypothetical protein ACFZAM_11110 [Streptomyces sp. NPDC008079]|uniref:hypothetical protein n=1 Tax=Streptomyces sp. NPDC008079 TaxID=3364806 RepID=UPI0036E4F9EA